MPNAKVFTLSAIGAVRIAGQRCFIDVADPYRPGLLGLDEFSHIQVIWAFDQVPWDGKTLTVPPCYRLLDHEIGLFATRGPFRPNPLALSACRLIGVDLAAGRLELDWIDAEPGSPVLDLKPYHPSADIIKSVELPAWCAHWPKDRDASGSFDWSAEFTF